MSLTRFILRDIMCKCVLSEADRPFKRNMGLVTSNTQARLCPSNTIQFLYLFIQSEKEEIRVHQDAQKYKDIAIDYTVRRTILQLS